MIRVGILALQGGVREHADVVRHLGADVSLVRGANQLADVDALILPGGESSVIDKLSRAMGLREPIIESIAGGLPVFGTCAGMILLADRILGAAPGQLTFGGIDVTVRRNAFGSQLESCETLVDVAGELGAAGPAQATFIRGPVVHEVGAGADVLATLPGGEVVAVTQGNLLATAFHPELSDEWRFHRWLIDRAEARR